MVGYVLHPIDSGVISKRHPFLLHLAKIVKLGFYTVPTWNRTQVRRVAVHCISATPRQHHTRIHI